MAKSFRHWFSPRISQAIQQPTSIAAIASVGFHGLLWVVVPLLPANSSTEELELPEPVEMVELTPAEMSRIPDFSYVESQLPSTSANRSGTSDLRTRGDWYDPLEDYQNDVYTPGPPTDYSFRGGGGSYYGGGGSYYGGGSYGGGSYYGGGSGRSGGRTSGGQTGQGGSTAGRTGQQGNTAETTETGETSETTETSPSIDFSYSGGTVALPDLLAANPAIAGEGDPAEGTATGDEPTLDQLLAYSADGTDVTAIAGALSTFTDRWNPELEARGATDLELARLQITAPYPDLACRIIPAQLDQAQPPLYGTVVDESGDLLSDPQILGSSGFLIFNRAGAEAIATHEFEAAGVAQMYLVTVEFEDGTERCAQLADSIDSPEQQTAEGAQTSEGSDASPSDPAAVEEAPDPSDSSDVPETPAEGENTESGGAELLIVPE